MWLGMLLLKYKRMIRITHISRRENPGYRSVHVFIICQFITLYSHREPKYIRVTRNLTLILYGIANQTNWPQNCPKKLRKSDLGRRHLQTGRGWGKDFRKKKSKFYEGHDGACPPNGGLRYSWPMGGHNPVLIQSDPFQMPVFFSNQTIIKGFIGPVKGG